MMLPEVLAMHRTQVFLEDDQYEMLHSQAKREGKSMGAKLREILATGLRAPEPASGPASRLAAAKGMFRSRSVRGRDHDQVLYGEER
jgi:plasmid stability protein